MVSMLWRAVRGWRAGAVDRSPRRWGEQQVEAESMASTSSPAAPPETSARRDPGARFRRMADAAPVLLWTAVDDRQRDFLNQSWLDFTGRPLALERGEGWLTS